MKHTFSAYKTSAVVLSLALLLVIVSVLFTNNLARRFQQIEEQKMVIWAEATEQLIQASEEDDLTLIGDIIESNTTIPVYMLDQNDSIIAMRNVTHVAADPTSLHGPLVIHLPNGITQSIYYEDSTILRQLMWFPYMEFGLIVLFILIAVITLRVMQQSQATKPDQK